MFLYNRGGVAFLIAGAVGSGALTVSADGWGPSVPEADKEHPPLNDPTKSNPATSFRRATTRNAEPPENADDALTWGASS